MTRKSGKQLIQQSLTALLKQKQALTTGVLLTTLVLLLFGIFSQLPAPELTTWVRGTTTIDYTTFLAQVRAGNVLVVSLQDQEIVAGLARPLTESQIIPTSRTKLTQQQAGIVIDPWYYIPPSDFSDQGKGTATTSPLLQPTQLVSTHLPESGDASLIPLLMSKHVVIKTQLSAQLPVWFSLIWKLLPFLLLLLVLPLVMNSNRRVRSPGAMGDSMSFNPIKNHAEPERRNTRTSETPGNDISVENKPLRARTSSPILPEMEPPAVTFADVAGIDEVRQEVQELVQFLRAPERFERLGARIPRGALLVGPPGTGKTLLAKAVAGEAGVPFFSVSASEFVEMYVGMGAKRVRELFHRARENAPCVIFLDELDAVGRKRSSRLVGNDERDQTLNQLLVELDGFSARQTIVVLAATNRADILDQALLRPGRFDRHINVSLPDRAGRLAILQVHTRHTPLKEEVSLERLAQLTTGMSGAELANLVNEAALRAARCDLERITSVCFEDALARVLLGAQRPIVLSETEQRIVAFHEAGHALVAHYLPEADRVNNVTIVPRGQSLGVTQFVAEEDRYNYSREKLVARLTVGLGGRAAEELAFGPDRVTTGAENDFQMVTGLARKMVTQWGMSERVGMIFVEGRVPAGGPALSYHNSDTLSACSRTLAIDPDGQLLLNGGDLPARQHQFVATDAAADKASSASMATMIDLEVQRLLSESYQTARALLNEHRDQLNRLALALMEREQLDRTAFEQLLSV
ncbi:MAG TPA: ATP-dependent zinc metalloprotease FtsH [Ktedonosporobacter sp.]|nr:ATP-dependent zinc metalloprotease FtsH [Ktedonosporobacter sp.]